MLNDFRVTQRWHSIPLPPKPVSLQVFLPFKNFTENVWLAHLSRYLSVPHLKRKVQNFPWVILSGSTLKINHFLFALILQSSSIYTAKWYWFSIYISDQCKDNACELTERKNRGNSLALQWLGLWAFTAEGWGSIPSREVGSSRLRRVAKKSLIK